MEYIYDDVVADHKNKMLHIGVRKTDDSRIMIQGYKYSLLYLSEYIKRHANGDTCYINVPLAINLLTEQGDDKDFEL